MKAMMMIALFAIPLFFKNTVSLQQLRSLYRSAAVVKDSSDKLSALLYRVNDASVPVLYCYKGASQLIRAKYSLNPVNKFSFFNEGKSMIETAIKADTTNFEMRYLRFTIQTNLPGFLMYHESVDKDRAFLTDHLNGQTDPELKEMATEYLQRLDTTGGLAKK